MAKLERGKDLGNVWLHKKKDQKDLVAEMSALEVKFLMPIVPRKKAAAALQAGQKDYVAVMIIMRTIIHDAHIWLATIAIDELIDKMDKHWHINGNNKNQAKKSDNNNRHETAQTEVNPGDKKCYNWDLVKHLKTKCTLFENNGAADSFW